jgi:phosphoglucosamine mutase
VLAVDEHGELVDGDQIIAICAIDRKARGRLTDDAVVVTVMTNLGFRLAMRHHGIAVVETAVGDRYVLEALEGRGLSLGGEQSGHVIFRDLATTGDGLLTGVQLLDVVKRTGRPLSALAAASMERLPQVLHNVRIEHRVPDLATLLSPAISAVEATLGERGRVLIRPSGTEPVVRVMVEAGTRAAAEEAAATLVAEVGRVARSAAGA